MKLVQWPTEYLCEACDERRTKYALMLFGNERFICPACLSELRGIMNAAFITEDIVSIDYYALHPKDRPQIP